MTGKIARLLLLVAALSLPAFADSYTINFNLTSGTLAPTSGTFNYDATTGFSNFLVVWDGITFDLTAPATELGGPVAFSILAGWYGAPVWDAYSFSSGTPQGAWFGVQGGSTGFGYDPGTVGTVDTNAQGGLTITDTTENGPTGGNGVPEPGTITLLLSGMLGLGLGKSRLGKSPRAT